MEIKICAANIMVIALMNHDQISYNENYLKNLMHIEFK